MVPKVKLVTELPWFNWIEEIGDPRQSNSQRKRTDPRFPISQESRLTKYVQQCKDTDQSITKKSMTKDRKSDPVTGE
nr:hypothetical protein CFP56_69608 [Quercus suber]